MNSLKFRKVFSGFSFGVKKVLVISKQPAVLNKLHYLNLNLIPMLSRYNGDGKHWWESHHSKVIYAIPSTERAVCIGVLPMIMRPADPNTREIRHETIILC